MLGAIIGDIVGSRFEFKGFKSKEFRFFTGDCVATDDSFMTLAIAKALVICKDWSDVESLKQTVIREMKEIASAHRFTGWGAHFYKWLFVNSTPYNSYGNGAGMRVSPVGWVAESEEEVKILSRAVTEISHNHPEGLKGAEAIAMAVFLARTGKDKEYIKMRMAEYYPLITSMAVDTIRPNYCIDDLGEWVTCQGSVPQSIVCFLESESFEDAVRNAISLGGDADTMGCMAGAIAEAYYGVSIEMEDKALEYLTDDLKSAYYAFNTIKRPRVSR